MKPTLCAVIGLVLAGLTLGGCRGVSGEPRVALAPGDYARAFDETKDLLASRQFTLERVDARAGIITTRPKATAGLATPWDTEQSSLRQEFEDVMNQQERRVRVIFAPAGTTQTPEDPGAAPADIRETQSPLEATFEVTLLRVSVPGSRPESSVIRLSSRTTDPTLTQRGVGSRDRIAIASDDAFAARLADDLRRRLGEPSP